MLFSISYNIRKVLSSAQNGLEWVLVPH